MLTWNARDWGSIPYWSIESFCLVKPPYYILGPNYGIHQLIICLGRSISTHFPQKGGGECHSRQLPWWSSSMSSTQIARDQGSIPCSGIEFFCASEPTVAIKLIWHGILHTSCVKQKLLLLSVTLVVAMVLIQFLEFSFHLPYRANIPLGLIKNPGQIHLTVADLNRNWLRRGKCLYQPSAALASHQHISIFFSSCAPFFFATNQSVSVTATTDQ